MKKAASRAIMRLAAACLGERRRDWSLAMQAEFETAAEAGEPLRFAAGCLLGAWREMVAGEEGHFVLNSYIAILTLLLPVAALQIGCALFGLPYLYPGRHGLAGALLEGGTHQNLIRSIYLAAVPSLALLQLLIGAAHLRIAWLLLDRDWAGVARLAVLALSAVATLVLFMNTLFLNSSQAVLLGATVAVELTIVAVIARRQMQTCAEATPAHAG